MTTLGIQVPVTGIYPEQHGLATMARLCEDEGADTVWVSDHVLMQDAAESRYPGNDDGTTWWDPNDPWYESLSCCAFIAASTSTVRIGPGVLILPQRHPLEVAKIAATIDRLSGGRLVLGVGIGWSREEMEALGHEFRSRAPRMEEMITVLRECWSGRPAAFQGRHIDVVPDLIMQPTPLRGRVPLIIGGEAEPALVRAARQGDGWLALAKHQYGTLDTDRLREGIARVRAARDEAGLGDEPYEMVVRLIRTQRESLPDLPALIDELAEIGFDEVVVQPPWDSLEEVREWIGTSRSATCLAERGARRGEHV